MRKPTVLCFIDYNFSLNSSLGFPKTPIVNGLYHLWCQVGSYENFWHRFQTTLQMIRLGNRATLGPLPKFIEYCRTATSYSLYPVAYFLASRSPWAAIASEYQLLGSTFLFRVLTSTLLQLIKQPWLSWKSRSDTPCYFSHRKFSICVCSFAVLLYLATISDGIAACFDN